MRVPEADECIDSLLGSASRELGDTLKASPSQDRDRRRVEVVD